MQQFSLDKWLKDKSRKICTRDGRPVRIVCWDCKNEQPIIALTLEPKIGIEIPRMYSSNGVYNLRIESSCDLFFADEEKTNKILDELKSYLEKTPKEQVEKDWKEIQDWYTQHLTNEKHNEKEELTEFEKAIKKLIESCCNEVEEAYITNAGVKIMSSHLLDLARKEIEKGHSEFKPKFTYNEKGYSELANKLIEFRNNTPLCSVSYRDGEGRKVILHYEKEIIELVKNEILKSLPKWNKEPYAQNGIEAEGTVYYNGWSISLEELFKILPKEE